MSKPEMRMHLHQNEDFHIPTKISNHQTKRTSSQIQKNHNNQTSSCATWHFSLDGLSLHHIRFHRSIKHHHLLFNFQLLRSHQTFSYITTFKKNIQGVRKSWINKYMTTSSRSPTQPTSSQSSQLNQIKCYRQNEHNNVHTHSQ
jgi:hypothetical protein